MNKGTLQPSRIAQASTGARAEKDGSSLGDGAVSARSAREHVRVGRALARMVT